MFIILYITTDTHQFAVAILANKIIKINQSINKKDIIRNIFKATKLRIVISAIGDQKSSNLHGSTQFDLHRNHSGEEKEILDS